MNVHLETKSIAVQQVMIFKTNIRRKEDTMSLKKVLDKIPAILGWNVDREDIDCVLRIESFNLSPAEVIYLINQEGYFCEELEG